MRLIHNLKPQTHNVLKDSEARSLEEKMMEDPMYTSNNNNDYINNDIE